LKFERLQPLWFDEVAKTHQTQKEEPNMTSFLRAVRRRKKTKLLGEAEVLSQEEYAALELDARVDLIRALIPLGMMHVEELLLEEVDALAGGRYERKQGEDAGVRYGSNKGSVRLGGQRVPIKVPRVRSDRGEISLRSYAALKNGPGQVDELLLRRVLYGISCRNYEAASESVPGAIGLSSSSVSRAVVEASSAKLREFQERDLSGQHYVAIFLDGKTFADTTMVVALGVRITGEKEFLGFVETTRHQPRDPGHRRRRQGSSQGAEESVQEALPGATLSVAQRAW
jgi:transposase-like protein